MNVSMGHLPFIAVEVNPEDGKVQIWADSENLDENVVAKMVISLRAIADAWEARLTTMGKQIQEPEPEVSGNPVFRRSALVTGDGDCLNCGATIALKQGIWVHADHYHRMNLKPGMSFEEARYCENQHYGTIVNLTTTLGATSLAAQCSEGHRFWEGVRTNSLESAQASLRVHNFVAHGVTINA